ncbi:carbohydrate sulfotransferase 10-like [Mizuhopecten yessoensis]|uniref:Carbohydrate sulfotransferase n=1 Tax=Mizuhopecten yessoensis TaxID=6573 RepID=A0A210PKW7_MIZYE|nr:carbohydrate sulfotransferase 10-like [Mizuhopecten yessoensis]OWF37133.1 Carbohydrate sulfotransferase 11 [Mizuhopecten yessoensis]
MYYGVLTHRWKLIQLILLAYSITLGITVLCFYRGSSNVEHVKTPCEAASGNVEYVKPQSEAVSRNKEHRKLQSKATSNDMIPVKQPSKEAFTIEPWKSRMDALKRGCASGRKQYQLTTSQVSQLYYSSSRAGFSVCKVPKAGSTFWTIMFLILQQQKPPEKVFLIPRNKLHNKAKGRESRQPPNDSSLNIIVSRDPYTRLFSGFIDKVFLAGRKLEENQDTSNAYIINDLVCGYNTTFADFLDVITKNALNGGKINQHLAPVYLLCSACNIKYQAVSHAETLTADTEYIVDKLQVSDSEKRSLKQMFHREEINKTLRGLLASEVRPLRLPKEICPDQLAYLYKLWQSLQIQGYLHIQSTFPWDFFENENNFEESSIVKLILDTMARRPLSNKDRKLQRRDALVSAYKNVGKETIKRIQKMFMMDFRLFGYDINPPT